MPRDRPRVIEFPGFDTDVGSSGPGALGRIRNYSMAKARCGAMGHLAATWLYRGHGDGRSRWHRDATAGTNRRAARRGTALVRRKHRHRFLFALPSIHSREAGELAFHRRAGTVSRQPV